MRLLIGFTFVCALLAQSGPWTMRNGSIVPKKAGSSVSIGAPVPPGVPPAKPYINVEGGVLVNGVEVIGGGVPYVGATQDLDLGQKYIKALGFVSNGAGPDRINFRQGVCPAQADAGQDYAVCIETDKVYKVSAAGVKTLLLTLADLGAQAALGYTPINATEKAQASGVATLDGSGKVPSAQIPAVPAEITDQALVFDGTTTPLADGSAVAWTCGSGSAAQCTASWTAPARVNWVRVQAWSGGAGGGGSTAGSGVGYGGGGGGYVDRVCSVTPGNAYTVAVGRGGGGAAAGPFVNAESGGSSSFGSCFTLLGGVGGTTTPTGQGGYLDGSNRMFGWQAASTAMMYSAGCTGTAAAGPTAIRPDGGGCGGGNRATEGVGQNAGNAMYGGGAGGGGGYNNATQGTAGTSSTGFGGAGGIGGGWTAGGGLVACAAGSIPGGGGGSAGAETAGGSAHTGCSGARGEVRVYYVQ